MSESRTVSSGKSSPWGLPIAIASVLSAVLILWLSMDGLVGWRVLGSLCAASTVGVLLLERRHAARQFQEMHAQFEEETRRQDELRESVRAREADTNRLRSEFSRKESLLEKERQEETVRLKQTSVDLEESRRQLRELQEAVGMLREQNGTLQKERSEALERRQLLQSQYQDLEATSKQLGVSVAERSVLYRSALESAEQARAELDRLRVGESGWMAESQKMRHQIERQDQERKALETRERSLRDEIDSLRKAVVESKAAGVAANQHRALSEELAARRSELDRLGEELVHQREQARLSLERATLSEQSRESNAAEILQLRDQLGKADAVIGELQDEVRNVSQEPRTDMARHFTWRLNFFEADQVRLSFLNEGASIDLVQVKSDPELPCVIEGANQIGRGGEGCIQIRPKKGGKIPDDFRLDVKYTFRTQIAAFRIRPFSSNKIERL